MRISLFNIMFCNNLGFQFEPERDSPQELFFKKGDENDTEQERSSSRVSQAVEEWCKCSLIFEIMSISFSNANPIPFIKCIYSNLFVIF